MIKIRLLVIPNAFKRQAEESDHRKVCVDGKFQRPVAVEHRFLFTWQRDFLFMSFSAAECSRPVVDASATQPAFHSTHPKIWLGGFTCSQ